MKQALAMLALVAACCGFPSGALAASADLNQKNELARMALKDGQFAKVLAITGEIARQDDLQPLNWYRMAIAAARTNDFRLALKAITTAEMLDPQLGFASSPGHVDRLKATIRAGLAGATALPAAPGSAPPDDVVQAAPPVAATAVVAPPVPAVDPGAIVQALAGVSGRLERMERASTQAAAAPIWQQPSAPAVGFSLLFLTGLAAVAFWLYAGARSRLQAARATTAAMPLTQLIQHNRDGVGMLLQRLHLHGHADTDLYVHLNRILPALERESGRVQINLAELTKGRTLADTGGKLTPRPMVLGQTDARSVHQAATRVALEAAGAVAAPAHDGADGRVRQQAVA